MELQIKFKEADFWTDESNILYCKPSNALEFQKMELDDVKNYIVAIEKITNGRSMPFLIDLRGIKGTFSILAAKELSKNKKLCQLRLSEAFVVNSISMKLLVLSYKRIFDPKTPFMLFNDMGMAKEYCKQIINKVHGSI